MYTLEMTLIMTYLNILHVQFVVSHLQTLKILASIVTLYFSICYVQILGSNV